MDLVSTLAGKIWVSAGSITLLYQFYFDVIRGEECVWKVEEKHKKYGKMVRVVLHINGPECLDHVFGTAGKRRDKYKLTTNGLEVRGAAIGTVPHDLRRSRRAPMNPYFSKQSIQRLKPILQRTLKKVLGRLAQNAGSAGPIGMQLLHAATTTDITSDHCFGQKGAKVYHQLSIISWFHSLIKSLPLSVAMFLFPVIKGTEGEMAPTIFRGLLSIANLSESETTPRPGDETCILLSAGSDTTANTSAAITVGDSILDPKTTMPELSQIEGLPYLTAIIQEGLRLYPSVSFRQDRVTPDEDLFYQDARVGKNILFRKSTTALLLSRNQEFYPSPMTFDPNRFLKNPRLDRYRLSFSRGSRRCLGIFKKYNLYGGNEKQSSPSLGLFEADREDVDMIFNILIPFRKQGSLGVRLRAR
ncbi:cytochrome P450 [Hyaloscypha bicolor E]|uniref:Cytochrome P450 n=1 Tax=Hyaloscypha bicolor E TaxID=1095630 RepID=A0A2J6STR5_9HELO|nr:cytochrome P450 [Hyaloscypha bicolor E]PMD54161.1 cytochrome P450 [Hyaloscypha bicolor E]